MPFVNESVGSSEVGTRYYDKLELIQAPGITIPANSITALANSNTNPLNISRYEALCVTVNTDQDGTSTAPVVGEKHSIKVDWMAGNPDDPVTDRLGEVEYDSNFPYALADGTRWTIPTRGSRCAIWYTNKSPNPVQLESAYVVGTNLRLRDRVDWLGVWSARQFNAPINTNPQRIGEWELSPFAYGDGAVYLNGLGNQVTVSLRISGAVTAAGVMRIRSTHNQSVIFAEAPIPVLGTFQTITLTARIPLSTPVDIAFSAPTTAAVSHLSVTWEDYEKSV